MRSLLRCRMASVGISSAPTPMAVGPRENEIHRRLLIHSTRGHQRDLLQRGFERLNIVAAANRRAREHLDDIGPGTPRAHHFGRRESAGQSGKILLGGELHNLGVKARSGEKACARIGALARHLERQHRTCADYKLRIVSRQLGDNRNRARHRHRDLDDGDARQRDGFGGERRILCRRHANSRDDADFRDDLARFLFAHRLTKIPNALTGAAGFNLQSPAAFSLLQRFVYQMNGDGALAHGGRYALDISRANIAHGKHARQAGLEQLRRALQGPARAAQRLGIEIGASLNEALLIHGETTAQPRSIGARAGHQENILYIARLFLAGLVIAPADSLQAVRSFERDDLGAQVERDFRAAFDAADEIA